MKKVKRVLLQKYENRGELRWLIDSEYTDDMVSRNDCFQEFIELKKEIAIEIADR